MRFGWLVLSVAVSACGGTAVTGPQGGGGGTGGSAQGGSSQGGSSQGGSGQGGSSQGGSGGSGGIDCNPSTVLCNTVPPTCPVGEVPTVENQCWGECVPVLDCSPISDCSACTQGLCAEYVAFTTEYRCVMPTLMCSALACSCLAPYFCAEPFSACQDTASGPAVSCECISC